LIAALAIPALAHLLLGLWVAWTIRRTPGWAGAQQQPAQDGAPEPDPEEARREAAGKVVCLVAARNEEASIGDCLNALLDQTVPLRVVVIDDHSEDATSEVVVSLVPESEGRLSVISGGPSKAMALADAVGLTSEEIILTTDADCRPPAGWAASMVAMVEHDELAALAGATMVIPSSTTGKLEALDWALLLSTSAALSESGRPVTAMGNNMAIRRGPLRTVGGFKAAARSVTEDYAVFRSIGEHHRVELRMAPELLNWTEPTDSLAEAFRQRRRWAIGGLDGSMTNRLIVIGSLLAFAAPIAIVFLAPVLGVGLILARWATTAGILVSAERRLGISLPKAWIPVHDVLLTLYVVLVPISILFSRTTRWKNRSVGDRTPSTAPNRGHRRDSPQA